MMISLNEMIAELRRELRYRQIIYPSLIKRGALTEGAADRQKARLQAAMDVLVSLEANRRSSRGPGTSDVCIDALRGVRRVDLFKEHAGAAFL